MAYQLPQRPHVASRRLTVALVGIYIIITMLVMLLNTGSNANTERSGIKYSKTNIERGTVMKNSSL